MGRAPEVGAGCELEVLEVLEHAGTCTCTFLHLHSSPTPLELVYIYIYIYFIILPYNPAGYQTVEV